MNNITINGNEESLFCEKDNFFLQINGDIIKADEFGSYAVGDDAPDYGCASFQFYIEENNFSQIVSKYKLTKEEEKLIRDTISSNWWGSSCGFCE